MAPFSKDDAAIFLRDGQQADTPVGSAQVYLDYPEDVEQFGTLSKPGQISGHPKMRYATDDLPGLGNGMAVQIGSEAYKVSWTRKLDDGAFSQAELRKG